MSYARSIQTMWTMFCFRRTAVSRARADTPEVPVQSDRVEDISGRTISVAALLEVLEALQGSAIGVDLRRKTSHHRERCASVGRSFQHPSSTLYLKGSPVENHHLAVQIGEGPKPEIAVLPNR